MDWTFRVSDLLTLVGMVIGGLWFVSRMEGQISSVGGQHKTLADAVRRVEGQMETVATAIVKIAVQDERLKSHSARLAVLEADIRRLERRDGQHDVAAG